MSLLRTRLRAFTMAQLQAAGVAGGSVFENRALSLTSDQLPAVIVQTPNDAKQSLLRGGPQFDTTVLLDLIVRATGDTDALAIAAMEALIVQVEAAILSNQAFIDQVQQFTSVRCEQGVSAADAAFVAEARMNIECEVYEDYRNPAFAPFTDINATVQVGAVTEAIDIPLPQ